MENPIFVDNQKIPQITHHAKDCEGNHDNGHDNYKTLVKYMKQRLKYLAPRINE